MATKLIASIMLAAALLWGAPGVFAAVPSDPLYQRQWYLEHLGMPAVWDRQTGSSDVIVAVIDSGVQIYHPDLRDNIWVNQREISGDGIDNDRNGYIDDVRGWDFMDNDPDPRPAYTPECFATGECDKLAAIHGTFVAGIIGARGDNGEGVAGMTWRVRIMPLRALGADGSGNVHTVNEALRYAIRNGAQIVNLSFVGYMPDDDLRAALEEAHRAGVLVVAAAGNAGSFASIDLDTTKVFPVCFDALDGSNIVMGVAASDEYDRLAGFSNYGPSCIDTVAPGKNFFGLGLDDPAIPGIGDAYTGLVSGTSLAAPVVSGVAALIKSQVPRLPVNRLSRLISETSTTAVNLAISDFPDKAAAAIIDPRAIFEKLSEDSYALGQYVALIPLGAREGTLRIHDGAGAVVDAFAFSGSPRPNARVAGGDLGVVITGADGKNSLSTYTYGDGSFQLTGYRPAFSSVGAGAIGVSAFKNSRGTGVVTIASPAGAAATVVSYNDAGLSMHSFLAFGDRFTRSAFVATGNIDGDADEEVVVGAGIGGGPQVRVFQGGAVQGQFFAYPSADRSGVAVAVGDLASDGAQEIVTVPAAGKPALVRVWSGAGKQLSEFYAYDRRFTSGAVVAVGDVLIDDGNEIIVAPRTGAQPVRIFSAAGKLLAEWYPDGTVYAGGYALTVLDAGYRD